MADLQQALGESWEKKGGDMGRDAHECGAGVTASTEIGTKGAAAGRGQHATNRSWWLLGAGGYLLLIPPQISGIVFSSVLPQHQPPA